MKKTKAPRKLINALIEAIFDYNDACDDKVITFSIGNDVFDIDHWIRHDTKATRAERIFKAYDRYDFYSWRTKEQIKKDFTAVTEKIKQMTAELNK